MLEYLHSRFLRTAVSRNGERGLIEALYKPHELKLEYDSTLTRNAAQTFADKRGNCLSLVIMTAAFARALDMNVTFQNVVTDQTWSRHGGLYFVSSHVNLTLGKRSSPGFRTVAGNNDLLTVDFLPPEDISGYHSYTLDEDTIVAMYMNNHAAEALATGRVDDAYWWAAKSITEHPTFIPAYNTLGVIYQRHGDHALSERVLKYALQAEPGNTVVMTNLVPVLADVGKAEESKAMADLVARIQPYPPFHFFNLGQTAMEHGDFATARAMFQKEVDRAPYYHEFHFWLALAYYKLGENERAKEQMALAVDTSTSPDLHDRYAAKLDHLKAMNPVRRN
jgi:Tfp pilus assembly protein PilF